jgi:hypothetical protein
MDPQAILLDRLVVAHLEAISAAFEVFRMVILSDWGLLSLRVLPSWRSLFWGYSRASLVTKTLISNNPMFSVSIATCSAFKILPLRTKRPSEFHATIPVTKHKDFYSL